MKALVSISDIHNGPDMDHCLAGFLAAKYNLSHQRFSLAELAGPPGYGRARATRRLVRRWCCD